MNRIALFILCALLIGSGTTLFLVRPHLQSERNKGYIDGYRQALDSSNKVNDLFFKTDSVIMRKWMKEELLSGTVRYLEIVRENDSVK